MDEQPAAAVGAVGVVVVTNQGGGDMLDRCLEAVFDDRSSSRVVVVDNSDSPDVDTDRLARWTDRGVTVRRVPNAGYGAAANVGIADPTIADAPLVALLNDDVTVTVGWLDPLVAAISSDPSVGAAQPKLVFDEPGPTLVNSLGVRLDRYGAGVDIGWKTPDAAAPTSTHPVDIVSGGAVVFRRAFLDDVGGFDERYFLYYEDVDISLRGAERGWTHRCVPSSVVRHRQGATTGEMREELRYLQDRNRMVAAVRFGSLPMVLRSFGLSIRRLRHEPRRAHRRALLGGIAKAPVAAYERVRARMSRR